MNTILLPRRRAVIATLAALGVLTAGIIGLRTSTAQPSGGPGAPQAMPVMVATVQESEVALWDEFSGRLEAWSAWTCARASRAQFCRRTSPKARS